MLLQFGGVKMERQYNEVTCDLCGKVKTTDV